MAADRMDEIADVFASRLRRRFPDGVPGDVEQAVEVANEAADWMIAHLALATDTTVIGRRIGPIYDTHDLTRWLTAPGSEPLTPQAVRKRAAKGDLVGFRTDDRQWAFPAWQFDRVVGMLRPRAEVLALWRDLPHDSWMSDADLAAWMNTELRELRATPAAHAHVHGAASRSLQQAVSRLRARAAA